MRLAVGDFRHDVVEVVAGACPLERAGLIVGCERLIKRPYRKMTKPGGLTCW